MTKDKEKSGCGHWFIILFGLFCWIIIAGIIASVFWDGFRYETAIECEANKPEITNCYEITGATVLELIRKPENLRTPNMEMIVETNDGRKMRGRWFSQNFGAPFFETDLLEVEIWKGKVITAKKANTYYRLADNPKLDFSKNSYFDIIIIVAIVLVIIAAIVITVNVNSRRKRGF